MNADKHLGGKTTISRIVLITTCLLIVGCYRTALERDFFSQPAADRVERLRHYSLDDQYELFRSGMDIEPPMMDLAIPIAERGAGAVPFLLGQLNASGDDRTVVDILLVFEDMATSRSYDVTSDAALMARIESKVSALKFQAWKDLGLAELARIKKSR